MDPVRRLSDRGLLILLFHGVVHGRNYRVRNYTGKHLHKDLFYNTLCRLSAEGRALSMDQVIEHCRDGRPFPGKAFALTFDDGFENNHSVAAPILKDLALPATFYVSTWFIQENAMSWIDRAEHCLEHAAAGSLKLPGSRPDLSFSSDRDKIQVLEYLRTEVKFDRSVDPDAVVSDLFKQCHIPEVWHGHEAIDRKMNWRQLRELAEDPDFTVGGHSHRHAILEHLSDDDLRREVSTSVDLLERHGGQEVYHYSYPEGTSQCYSERVIDVLKAHGIRCCPTARDGLNDHRSDLFRLKRTAVARVEGASRCAV